MPKFVQQVTGKSYSYVGPKLDWARGKISLLDGACGKLETIVTPIIATTDKCIDITVGAVSTRVSAVQTSVANRILPVQTKIGEVQGAMVVRSLDFVDSSESLIDRLLPLPSKALRTKTEKQEKQAKAELLSRVARLPFAVPLRVTMIMYVKANGAVEAVFLSGRQFVNVAVDKQNQFAQQVMQRAQPLTDKVTSITTPAMQRVRAGKDSAVQTLSDGRQMVVVRVNNMVIKLHLVEVKDWSCDKASNLKSGTMAVVMAMVRTARGTTTRVIGQHRTTTLFAKLHLPIEIEQQQLEVRVQKPVRALALEMHSKPAIKKDAKKDEPKVSNVSSIVASVESVLVASAHEVVASAQEVEGAIAG